MLSTIINTGYKVFYKGEDDELYPLLLRSRAKPLSKKVWLNERFYRVNVKNYFWAKSDNLTYRPGWHIYLDRNKIPSHLFSFKEKTVLAKVKFREILALGKENDGLVIVAKEIMILEEENINDHKKR